MKKNNSADYAKKRFLENQDVAYSASSFKSPFQRSHWIVRRLENMQKAIDAVVKWLCSK